MSSKIQLSWDDYERLWSKLYWDALEPSGFEPDYVVVIARGGMALGQCISNVFDVPAVIVVAESYHKGERDERISFARHSSYTSETVEGRVLVVDDLTDSGRTLFETENYIREKFSGITVVRTACLFHKAGSVEKPDFFAEEIPVGSDGSTPWLVFPWEYPPRKAEKKTGVWLPDDT